ncbi:DUF3150 domain-containing protein, partial [Vibrio cholerae]
ERLKKEAQRLCEQVGVRFLGGYAVPEDRIDQIVPELDRIGQDFAQCKQLFLDNYDQVTFDWVAKHPEFADAIRRALSPIEDVEQRLQFDYAIYRMQPAEQAGGLDGKVNGMGHTLFREVARDANELFERSVAGKNQISQRALNPLKRLRDKLDGLSFLDHRVQPMVEAMDNLFVRLPKTGPVTDNLYHELMATILILSDPDKMRMHGEGQLDIRQLMPKPEPKPAQPVSAQADNLRAIPQPTVRPNLGSTVPNSFYF